MKERRLDKRSANVSCCTEDLDRGVISFAVAIMMPLINTVPAKQPSAADYVGREDRSTAEVGPQNRLKWTKTSCRLGRDGDCTLHILSSAFPARPYLPLVPMHVNAYSLTLFQFSLEYYYGEPVRNIQYCQYRTITTT